MGAIREIFSSTPRMLTASFLVYAVSQAFDVWLYHKWWAFTEKKYGDRRKFLWLRNNGSTLLSQLLNTLLFTLAAFWGTYDGATLLSILFHPKCAYQNQHLYIGQHCGKDGNAVKPCFAKKTVGAQSPGKNKHYSWDLKPLSASA